MGRGRLGSLFHSIGQHKSRFSPDKTFKMTGRSCQTFVGKKMLLFAAINLVAITGLRN
jgi:hypothetical protein